MAMNASVITLGDLGASNSQSGRSGMKYVSHVASESVERDYDDLPLQCNDNRYHSISLSNPKSHSSQQNEIFIYELNASDVLPQSHPNLVKIVAPLRSRAPGGLDLDQKQNHPLYREDTHSASQIGEPSDGRSFENSLNSINARHAAMPQMAHMAQMGQMGSMARTNDNVTQSPLMLPMDDEVDEPIVSMEPQVQPQMEDTREELEPLTPEKLKNLCEEMVDLNTEGKIQFDPILAGPCVALESALNQQLFCRNFKKRQPYSKVGDFALKLASLDKSGVLPTMKDAWEHVNRYKENLFIYKTKKYQFCDENNKYLCDSQFFWKQIFNELIDVSKDQYIDCSFSLQRGQYPELETLFVNLRIPFLSDSKFDEICPMLLDLYPRQQFGFHSSYIVEFHDVAAIIEYLRHLWPFEPNQPHHMNNTIEINCICLSGRTTTLPKANAADLRKDFEQLGQISKEQSDVIRATRESMQSSMTSLPSIGAAAAVSPFISAAVPAHGRMDLVMGDDDIRSPPSQFDFDGSRSNRSDRFNTAHMSNVSPGDPKDLPTRPGLGSMPLESRSAREYAPSSRKDQMSHMMRNNGSRSAAELGGLDSEEMRRKDETIAKLHQTIDKMREGMRNKIDENKRLEAKLIQVEEEGNKSREFLKTRVTQLKAEMAQLKQLEEENNKLKQENKTLETKLEMTRDRCKMLAKELNNSGGSGTGLNDNYEINQFMELNGRNGMDRNDWENENIGRVDTMRDNRDNRDYRDMMGNLGNAGNAGNAGIAGGMGGNELELTNEALVRIALEESRNEEKQIVLPTNDGGRVNNNYDNINGLQWHMNPANRDIVDEFVPNNEQFYCRGCSDYQPNEKQIKFVNCQCCNYCVQCAYRYVKRELDANKAEIKCPVCRDAMINEYDIGNADPQGKGLVKAYLNLQRPQSFECQICMTEHPIENVFVIDACKHEFCRECAQHSIKADLTYTRVIPRCPQCLASDDKKIVEVPQKCVELVLEGQELQLYHSLTLQGALQGVSTFQCPTPDCVNLVETEEKDEEFNCAVCKLSSCVKCLARPYHKGETCQECKKRKDQQKEELNTNQALFDKLAKEAGWKPCPTCKLVQERIYGCFHMKCGNPGCKTEYCDECGEKLDPKNWQVHFNVGKCKLWSSEKDLLDPNQSRI